MVRKAIVLAAGLGTRLRPLTTVIPKPLLPIWGEPMIARIVAELRARGVTDIVVNCHYLHGLIEAWCKENDCKASYEREILGTGGVLNPLRDWINNEPFYLVNGDIVIDSAPELTLPKSAEVIGTALVSEVGPRTIEVEPESKYVTCWQSPDPGYDGTFTYCGFALLKPEILNYVKDEGFSSIVEAYEKAMLDGKFIKSVTNDEMSWTDAGTIDNYLALNESGEDNAFGELPQLKATINAPAKFMAARGSERVFFKSGDKIAIIYDDSNRVENGRYAAHAKWLKTKGISVPEVIDDRPDINTLVMADAGAERKMTLEEYVKVIEALAKFNSLKTGRLKLEPQFDAKLYQWERELFFEHCLGSRFMMECPKAAKTELENVASILEKEPRALVHRDFQSTNILWRGDKLTFIDFQGMRLGPAAYDLASIVYDPYVSFTEGERRALIKLYAKKSGREDIAKIVPFAAVERLVQCLGAYGRLASVGKHEFCKFVLPALENLLVAADEANLDAVGALAEELIAKERERHHHHDHTCSCGHHHH